MRPAALRRPRGQNVARGANRPMGVLPPTSRLRDRRVGTEAEDNGEDNAVEKWQEEP